MSEPAWAEPCAGSLHIARGTVKGHRKQRGTCDGRCIHEERHPCAQAPPDGEVGDDRAGGGQARQVAQQRYLPIAWSCVEAGLWESGWTVRGG